MDFDFSDDQYLFRDTVRSYLTDRFAGPRPERARPTDEETFTLQRGLADLGIFSALVPESFGGLGLNVVDLVLLYEEFGRALIPPIILDTLVATDVLVRFGNEQQKNLWLAKLATGNAHIALAIGESEADYGPAVRTVLSNGMLTGSKILVAEAASASKLLVQCEDAATKCQLLLLIEAARTGVRLRRHETLDVSCDYYEVNFESVSVEPEDVISETAAAAPYLADAATLAAAAQMVGISGKVFDATVKYVKQRTQFGKPLGAFQAIKHRCADMLVSLNSSRSAAYYAAWSLDRRAADLRKSMSIAKSFCGDSARYICDQGVQLHGGMGFTWELGLHFFMRRAKMLEYAYGDAVYHRKRLLQHVLEELGVDA